jgi:23S rRNA pseudouridine1911/1915/1917 synthase
MLYSPYKTLNLVKDIQILFENADMIAINKPAGIAVHGDGRSKAKTISDWVLKHYPKTKNVGENLVADNGKEIARYGIVHRLDKDTSGVLLIAKTNKGYEHLKSQFKDRKIKKTYYAFIYGKMRDERGIIDRPIGRAIGSVRKWETRRDRVRGEVREAVTRFKVIKNTMPASLLELWPQTGRTHQIRVHMQALGHPVVADRLYAPTREVVYGFERLALHARRLLFLDLRGNLTEVEAPFPSDFIKAIELLGIKL